MTMTSTDGDVPRRGYAKCLRIRWALLLQESSLKQRWGFDSSLLVLDVLDSRFLCLHA